MNPWTNKQDNSIIFFYLLCWMIIFYAQNKIKFQNQWPLFGFIRFELRRKIIHRCCISQTSLRARIRYIFFFIFSFIQSRNCFLFSIPKNNIKKHNTKQNMVKNPILFMQFLVEQIYAGQNEILPKSCYTQFIFQYYVNVCKSSFNFTKGHYQYDII